MEGAMAPSRPLLAPSLDVARKSIKVAPRVGRDSDTNRISIMFSKFVKSWLDLSDF